MKTLQELKNVMSIVKNVRQWNEIREKAKKEFSQELINQLDASGYIHKVLYK